MATTPTKKINITIYFENLTLELYVFYILIINVKFSVNYMLFTIRYINLFFISNFRRQKFKI